MSLRAFIRMKLRRARKIIEFHSAALLDRQLHHSASCSARLRRMSDYLGRFTELFSLLSLNFLCSVCVYPYHSMYVVRLDFPVSWGILGLNLHFVDMHIFVVVIIIAIIISLPLSTPLTCVQNFDNIIRSLIDYSRLI